ncbi:carnitine deficiency associated protein [Echinococcus multilocularis]|uniref:Carnitine deficiency associated protein n=1 Tax=Echinococcus multilocularis TaxID=6211 RepID=A0A068Y6M4_ECHMU|nr:carnitine deficiency associated protein [Echinococcus multilocularis]
MSVLKVLRRKLEFLGYPSHDTFSIQSNVDVARLLVWLEDRVICSLPIGDRFRDVDSEIWPNYIDSYLKKLGCPYGLKESQCMVDWLLNLGIETQTGDKDGNSGSKSRDTFPEADIFANIDTDGPQFKEGVRKLAEVLNVPQHPDPKQTFRGVCVLIEKMLSKEALKRASGEHGKKVELLEIEDIFLGFDVEDPALRPAAVALRLLHVSELRNLQDLINFAIVKVQQLTADPKTDEKLGQVGF